MFSRHKQVLGELVVLFVLIVVLCLATTSHAATPAAATDPKVILANWSTLNDQCIGGAPPPIGVCEHRDNLGKQLYAQGYRLGEHDVWYTLAQVRWLGAIAQQIDLQFGSAAQTDATDTLVSGAYTAISQRMDDAQLFAIWNDYHGVVRDSYPLGWAVLCEMMPYVIRKHAQSNDPRYNVDGY